jgi:O-antigen/teichoic acid export membrane protein
MFIYSKIKLLANRPVAKSIGIYALTNFLGKAISFLLIFIFTNERYMSPSDNGLLSLLNTSLLFVMPFISMGILYSVSTDFFKLGQKEFKDLFTTSLIVPLLLTFVAVLILFIFRKKLHDNYGFPDIFIWLIPLITFFNNCYEQYINMVRNNNEPVRFFWTNISKIVIELSVSVILVVFFSWHWKGRITGIIVSYSIISVYAFYYFFKKDYLFGKVTKKHLYNELMYALPIILLQASIFFLSASDKLFLAKYTNDHNATVGFYSIGALFASVVTILSTALLQFLFPKIYTTLSEVTVNYVSIKRSFYFYLATMAAGAITVMCVTPLLYKYFINHKYSSALQYIYLLCIGSFLWATSYFFYSFLLYNKEKKNIMLLAIICILVSICSNWFFISRWGAMGAAVGVCTSNMVVLAVTLVIARKYVRLIFSPHFLSFTSVQRN